MTKSSRPGRLIAIEGGEGAGKSTLIAALESCCRESGREAVRTREPGGTPLGDVISQIVRRGRLARRLFADYTDAERWADLGPVAELLLFEAARAQNVRDVIRPAVDRGAVVLCDRFTASTIAYQGYGRGLPLDDVVAANRIATGGLEPDLVLLLDLPPAVGLGRATTDPVADRLRAEELAFHERVRRGFHDQAAADAGRWAVIDAQQPPDDVVAVAWERVRPLL